MAKKQRTDDATFADDSALTDPEAAPMPPPDVRPRRFRVSLPHQPTLELEAESEQLAIAAFNQANGILQTDQQYSVQALDKPE